MSSVYFPHEFFYISKLFLLDSYIALKDPKLVIRFYIKYSFRIICKYSVIIYVGPTHLHYTGCPKINYPKVNSYIFTIQFDFINSLFLNDRWTQQVFIYINKLQNCCWRISSLTGIPKFSQFSILRKKSWIMSVFIVWILTW